MLGSGDLISVPAMSLDDFIANGGPIPHVVKIDVEGAELEVLRGSSRLFEACRPIVLCEVIPDTAPEVTEFFSSRGYQIFDGEIAPAKRQPLDLAPWSTLAIPA